MSWMRKLCEVYDTMIGVEGCELLPMGLVEKKIEFNIILSEDGQFVTAQRIPKANERVAIPSTPSAEARTGENGKPFPLAEQLKYLVAIEGKPNPRWEAYVQQLAEWCKRPDAPPCLKAVLAYLEKGTLLSDLENVPQLKLRYHKEEQAQDEAGADAKKMACFSVETREGENRLWERSDVRESWVRYAAELSEGESELCYVTGQRLPLMENHPKLEGNAKLISAKDAGFPFQYKGRFVEDRSAAEVSWQASAKAHNALRWLLKNQGFQRYGMSFVAWNTAAPDMRQEESLFTDEEAEEPSRPDTFEAYARALCRGTVGDTGGLRPYADPENLTEDARRRVNEIVMMGLQAATDGRMSITYYQELPGNLYVQRLRNWDRECTWEMPGKKRVIGPPSWRAICEAVMGRDLVRIALQDMRCEKSATKLMREMQMRLLSCVVNGSPLPKDFVRQAFERAIHPLSFTDSKGKWSGFSWAQCVATACALIRKDRMKTGQPEISPVLNREWRERDYLYGRLLAVAHKLELDATGEDKHPTAALRAMARVVQNPREGWLHLYGKLLPFLKKLGQGGPSREKGYQADRYLRLLGEIERQFQPEERWETRPLSQLFLAGFSAQLRELYQKREERQPQPVLEPYAPPQERDELFGCLLAIADMCEWNAVAVEREGRRTSPRDGRTNAMRLTAAFQKKPSLTWMHIHEKLVPYLEKSGVSTAKYMQRLIHRVEQEFSDEERWESSRLDRNFLYGYLGMRSALTQKGGLDAEAWTLRSGEPRTLWGRSEIYGALLALADQVERWVLDREKEPEENRPSNALRFLARAAQKPNEVTEYLLQRMRPYQRKAFFSDAIRREQEELCGILRKNGWYRDEPLTPEYLNAFYTYSVWEWIRWRSEREDETCLL